MAETRRVTLTGALAALVPADRVLVLRRMGPHECKLAAMGAAEELRTGRCAEVCGEAAVEGIAFETGCGIAMSLGELLPVYVVTICNGET